MTTTGEIDKDGGGDRFGPALSLSSTPGDPATPPFLSPSPRLPLSLSPPPSLLFADTRNVAATVEQVKRCVDAGAELVRITVQGKKEAQACMEIREALFKDRYDVPLVADIHFQPQVAMMVAEAFEKIRINPGNFADGRKTFDEINYDDPAQFQAEKDDIAEAFLPLVQKCKALGRAMRIGTNHGSLSARILSFYGDTPRGMVESAFEFADICRREDYHNFLFSMKASNPLVMVQAYRLLAEEQYARGWDYPLHLGVTEVRTGMERERERGGGEGPFEPHITNPHLSSISLSLFPLPSRPARARTAA